MITERAVSLPAAAPAWPLLPAGEKRPFQRDAVTGTIEERTHLTWSGTTRRLVLAVLDPATVPTGPAAARAVVEEAALRPYHPTADLLIITSPVYWSGFDEALIEATGEHLAATVVMTEAEAKEAIASGKYAAGPDMAHASVGDAVPAWRIDWVTSARHLTRALPEMTSETRSTEDGHTVIYARTEAWFTAQSADDVRRKIAPNLVSGDTLVIEARDFGPNVGPAVAAAMPDGVTVSIVWNPEVDTLPVNWTRATV